VPVQYRIYKSTLLYRSMKYIAVVDKGTPDFKKKRDNIHITPLDPNRSFYKCFLQTIDRGSRNPTVERLAHSPQPCVCCRTTKYTVHSREPEPLRCPLISLACFYYYIDLVVIIIFFFIRKSPPWQEFPWLLAKL
jgi:hypothetical protein